MKKELRGQTGDRKARQEALKAPGEENVGAWTGAGALEAEGSGLVRDSLGVSAVTPPNWSPCFHLCPLQSIHHTAAQVILVKTMKSRSCYSSGFSSPSKSQSSACGL